MLTMLMLLILELTHKWLQNGVMWSLGLAHTQGGAA